MSENVVGTADVAPLKVPKSFNDLKIEQLRKAAVAFGSNETGNKEEIKADLLEFGVTFDQYLKMFHPDVTAEPVEEVVLLSEPEVVNEGGEENMTVVTASANPVLAATEKYLIKFIGENPYFEYKKYKFTQEKPYGIMPAEDAQSALVGEPTKFRQAFPAELEEFYS